MSRIVAVSNRLPSLVGGPPKGGIAGALGAVLEEAGGVWVGWSGREADLAQESPDIGEFGRVSVHGLDLPAHDIDGFYNGFANRTLWPLCHGRVDLAVFDEDTYHAYRRVNRQFATWLARFCEADDLVWVHDYHLVPLGLELRRKGFRGRIGFFLHVPVPPREIACALPWAGELTAALAAYDLVGVQTSRDWWNLCDLLINEAGGRVEDDGAITLGEHRVRTDLYPIGIDVDRFAAMATVPQVAGVPPTPLPLPAGGERLILGVDRLDYSKGVPQRLRAFARLLEREPELRGRVRLVQISAPSREEVPEYQALRSEVEALTGHINGRFGDLRWQPVCFLNRSFAQEDLARLYRAADVGLVTPLADGMNLVAKEYGACQDPNDPGVLVLSRFAGAAELMPGALVVNPHDIDGLADALGRALRMPLAERRQRHGRMIAQLRRNDVHDWGRRFLGDLAAADGVRADAYAQALAAQPRLAVLPAGA